MPPLAPKQRARQSLIAVAQQLLILAILVFLVSFINNSSEILLSGLLGSTWTRWLFASIGTPVHELSHALIALLFGYTITDMRLFIPDPASATLGYVSYSYNQANLFQQIGHFFVGIAPVLLPLLVVYLLYRLLIPRDLASGGRGQWRKLLSLKTLLFLFLAAQIVLHMRCSSADLAGAQLGLPLLILLLFLLGLIVPKAQRYLLAASTMLTVLTVAFSLLDHLLIRGALLLFG